MDRSPFNADEVRGWLEAVRADLASLNERMQPLLEEQTRLEEREALLHNLLQSFATAAPAPSANGSARAIRPTTRTIGEYVVEHAIEILREAGTPLHINDLHERFRERGFRVPGAGAPANLIVHLRKSPEIASPQRGMYALTELVGPISRPKTKRRTTRRRKKGS